MKAKLQLFLKGELFQETEFEITEFPKKMVFSERVDLQKAFIDRKIREFRFMYFRQIDKVHYNYRIDLVLESRVGMTKQDSLQVA